MKRTASKRRRRVESGVLFGLFGATLFESAFGKARLGRGSASRFSLTTILTLTAILPIAANWGRVEAADGDCLWGASSEKTTYLPAYNPLFPPDIPVLTHSEATAADGTGAGTSATTNGVGGGSISVPLAETEAKLAETGTVIGSDGKTYSYRYVKGVQPVRVVETRRVYETPPGGLFPVWSDVKTEKIVWKPVLIKMLSPLNASVAANPASWNSGAVPAPCRPIENGARR